MANALSLFRSFFTGGLFTKSTKIKKRSFRPNLLILDPRINPASVNLSGATGWTPIMIGATKDYANDSQAGAADTDIIGDATHGSLYTAFDDNNTANTADDTLVFRMRINNPTSTTNFAGVAIVGLDANQDGRVDIFLSVDGRNNGQAIRIFDPGTGLNNSPNTTTTNPLTIGILPNNGVYSFSANNYSVVPVSATSDPNWNGQTDGLNGGNIDGNDAFISWRLPIANLATVLAKPSPVDRSGMYGPRGSTGIPGFTKDTVVQYINFTQTQTGPINGDMNGLPRNYDGSATFSSLGAFTTLMSSANPVPAATVLYINEPIGDGNLSASESTSLTISGTTNAPAGSTIQLIISDSSSGTTDVTATATVISGSNGVNTWSVSNVNVSSQVDGSLTVTASVIVNSITSTDTAVVSLDQTGPAIAINTLPTTISGTPTFTGTTNLPAGSTLTITIDPDNDPATNNNIVYTTLVQSNGTWSLDTSLQTPTSGSMPSTGLVSFSKVTVSGTDAAGNHTTATILNKPTVTTLSTNDTTPLVSGTWTNIAGDVLSVTVNGVSYTPTISGNTWTVQVTNALVAGATYELVATVTRGASSVTDATSSELTITSTPVVTIGITGGSSSTTSNTLPTISGTSNITSGTIIVQIDPNNDGNMADAVTYSVTSDSSGNWTLNTGNNANLISGSIPLSGYSGTIHIYAENLTGTATAEQTLTIITPTVAISTITSGATTNSFATVNNTGAAANYLNMTEDDSVTVTGTAPNGYTVDLVIRDPNGNFVSQSGIVVSSGTWSVSGLNLSNLDDGVLNITATLSGTTTTTTNTAVTHDKTAPKIFNTTQTTVQKTSGAVYKGSSELVSGTQISVGLYTSNTYATLDHTLLTTTVDAQGNWSVTTTSNLNNSTNPVYVRVQPVSQTTDAAGNIVQINDSSRVVSQSQGNVSAIINVYSVTGDNQIVLGEIGSGITITGDTNQISRTVTVTVTDGTTTITKTTTSGSTYTSGTQNWSVSLTNAEVKSLRNGQLTVTGSVADGNGVSVSDIELPSLNLASPTLSITDNVPGTVIGSGTVTFTFTFTEGVTGFDATDVVVTNGTIGTFSTISASSYTLVVTPTANSSGAINVSVASGAASGVNTGRGNTPASASQNFNTTTAASVPTITIDIDNLATSSSPIISGTTSLAAGAPVIVTIDPDNDNSTNNNITYSATVQSGGTWSVNTATETPDTGVVPFEGLSKYANITATAINAFGLSATVTGLNKPTVNTLITNITTPTVTGTWANIVGDTLTVTVNGLSYTPTINGNTWSVAVTNPLANGASYEVVATVNRTSTSTSKVDISSNEVTVDTNQPTVAITSITFDTGTAGDFKTNDTTLVYNGTAETNSTVLVTLWDSQSNVVFSSSVIASGGNWSLDRTGFALPEGTYTLNATAMDAAGNSSAANQSVIVDLTGPIIAITSGRDTNSSTPFITGTTDLPVGSIITITVDHDNDGDYAETGTATYTTTVQAGGLWSVQATTVITGTVGVMASGTDEVGNTTTTTQPLTLNVNIPVIIITEPLDTNGNSNGILDAVEDNSVVISGTSANVPNGASITVTITDGTTTITDTAIVSNNSWNLSALNLSSLANGTIFVTANYLDGFGNFYSDTASVLHDKTSGVAISIDSISQDTGVIADFITNDQTLVFTGSTTAAASVTVVIKDSNSATVQTFSGITANSSGTWTTSTSNTLIDGNYTIEATTGSTTATQAFTIDLTAPSVPTVQSSTTTSNTPIITGTVSLTAGDVLRVTVDGITYSVGTDLTVNSGAGTWSLQIPGANALQGGTYSVTATVTDVAGNVSTDSTTNELIVNTVNPSPIVTTSNGTTSFTEANNTTSTPVIVDSGITVTDPDNITLTSATVTISAGYQAGQDILGFVNDGSTMGNISGSYSSGVLLLTSSNSTATVAQWQSALQAVTYTNSSNTPNTSNRTISFVVNDGTNDSNTATKQVSITATNDTPIVTTSNGITVFTEGNNTTSTPVVVDSGITVTDADNTTLASATVSITTNFQSGEDVLGLVLNSTMGSITTSYSSGVLTLTGPATVAQWQSALQAVTYTNSSNTPNTSNRTISFVVNDGTNDSNTATKQVSITATNDTPTVANAIPNQNATEDTLFSYQFVSNTFADVDVGDTLTYSAQLNGGGALPAWLSFDPLTRTFSGTPSNSDVGTISIDVTANDGNGGTVSDTFNIVVANIPDVINVTSSTVNGYYKAGDAITILVQFDESVIINTTGGTPYLVLETGTTDRNATYASGSGTSTLTFIYTVQPGDTTQDLDYVSSSSLILNGGTIQNFATSNAVVTLTNPGTIGSLGANKAIVIDTTPPSVGPIDIDSVTDTGANDSVTSHGNPIITFNGEAGLTITLTGPNNQLLNSNQYTVAYSAGTYTVMLVDANLTTNGNQPFGTYSGSNATGNAANEADGLYTIKATDFAGNQADVGTFTIDTTPPGINPNPFGPIDIDSVTDTGANDSVTSHGNPIITFNGEAGLTITLTGPNNQLLNSNQYTVTYSAGTYTVTLVDANLTTNGNQPFGTYSGSNPTGNAANEADGLYTIKATDFAGNQADVGTFTIDTTKPSVTITSSVSSLNLGASTVLTITFLEIPVGFSLGDFTATSGSVSSLTPTNDPKIFTANYTAPNASVGTETINITNGSYTDQAGNNGDGFSLNQQITSIVPTLIITSDKSHLEFGQTATLRFTFSEAPFGFTVNDISATNGTLGSLIVDPNSPNVYTVIFTPLREFIGNSIISVTNGAYTNSANTPGLGASISPSISIFTKIRGFVATGDDSEKAGRRINQTNEMRGTSVVLYDPTTGEASGSTVPFNNYQGQIRVARADTNNDGILEMVVSTGPGGPPELKIIDSSNGNVIGEIIAYDPNFSGGVFVSIVDINNDGYSEIVTGAGESGGPHVKVFDSRTKSEIFSFFAYDTDFRGGVSVAAYDVDRDGVLDIITGAGPGGGPHVKVFSGRDMHIIKEFMAYDPNFRGGVFVAIGDFMSDGTLEIITGPGIGGGPHLKVWDYSTLNLIAEKMVYDKFTKDDGQVIDFLFAGGVRVGLADGNDDGILDVIVGAGPTGGPHVKVLAGFDLEVIRNFFSGEKTDSRGVFVSQ